MKLANDILLIIIYLFWKTYYMQQRSPQKLQPNKMQDCEEQSQLIHLENIVSFKAQRTMQKREEKDCKIQRIRAFAVRLFLTVISETTPTKYY